MARKLTPQLPKLTLNNPFQRREVPASASNQASPSVAARSNTAPAPAPAPAPATSFPIKVRTGSELSVAAAAGAAAPGMWRRVYLSTDPALRTIRALRVEVARKLKIGQLVLPPSFLLVQLPDEVVVEDDGDVRALPSDGQVEVRKAETTTDNRALLLFNATTSEEQEQEQGGK